MIRVAWICHFSNKAIQEKLALKKRVNEYAPWISLSIEEIKKRDDIELHVIAPHKWITKDVRFRDGSIWYYFFNPGIPFVGRHWPMIFKFDYWSNFYFNKRKINKLVNEINPQIINLHGIENSYYSTSIFNLKKYPILITIQGVKSLYPFKSKDWLIERDIEFEQRILKEFNNYGVRVRFLLDYIKEINECAQFHWFKYPFESFGSDTNTKKEYDCVYFASIVKQKGIEDLIEAIYLVKKKIPGISLNVIGGGNQEYIESLRKMITNKGLDGNINIIGFMSNHKDVHAIVQKSKLSILPTYNDILPGTIIESLKSGVPVIAYAANGVVDFNNDDEVIRLVDVGDIDTLAKEIENLLNNENERELLKSRGLLLAKKEFNNSIEVDKMINSYKKILNVE